MAYQISRAKKITESLELVDKEGNVAKTINVDIDINRMALKINHSVNDLSRAQMSENMEAIGNAVISLFDTVFGEEQEKDITNFYENNYVEMVECVLPFIFDCILPKIKEATMQVKSELANNYKFNRKQRRKLGI